MTRIEESNEQAKRQYEGMITVEISRGAIHVTINGQHYVNDSAKLDEALMAIKTFRG